MGWEPKRYTTTDPDGAQVTTTDPEWDDRERDKMIGLEMYEAGICDGCGVHKSRQKAGEHFYDIGTHQCPTCAALSQRGRIYAVLDHEQEARLEGLSEKQKAEEPLAKDGRSFVLREISREEHEKNLAAVKGGD